LLADDNIEHIYPKATFNTKTGFYDMVLDVKRDKNIIGLFGGNVSSSPINEAFIELQYKYFGRSSFNISANSYFGRFYSSVQLRGRFDVPARTPFYLESFFNMGQWDFFQSSTTFFEDKKKSYLIQNENFWNFNAGLPAGNKARIESGVTLAHLRDDYYQTNLFSRYDTTDRTYFNMVTPYFLFERNTLNRKVYPNQGTFLSAEVRYINGLERYFPGSTSINKDYYEMPHDWYQVRFRFEHYFKMKFFRSGVYAEALFSDPGFFKNYTSSALMAPAFQPIPESKTLFMPNYRAYTYGAFGLKNIFVLFKRLDFRLEAFVFQPYREIHEYEDFSPWLEIGRASCRERV
jgi:NTE family protein